MITPKIAQDMREEIEALSKANYFVFEQCSSGKGDWCDHAGTYDDNAIRINQLRYELKKREESK